MVTQVKPTNATFVNDNIGQARLDDILTYLNDSIKKPT